jgi:hypothetical protein
LFRTGSCLFNVFSECGRRSRDQHSEAHSVDLMSKSLLGDRSWRRRGLEGDGEICSSDVAAGTLT